MNSFERAAPKPSQGGSSLEAKPDEQDRLNVPRLLLNDGHSLPQLGFGVWQIDNADAPEIIGTAIHAGYRLIDTAASGTQGIPRPRAHPPARRRRRSGRDGRRQRRVPGPPRSPRSTMRSRTGSRCRCGWPSRPAGRRMETRRPHDIAAESGESPRGPRTTGLLARGRSAASTKVAASRWVWTAVPVVN
jgi:hypothetical protein